MEDWLGIIGVLVGVVVTWVLNEATQSVRSRLEADKKLRMTAFICLDRLLKIQDANARSNVKQRDGEIHYLGADMDLFRNRIAASSSRRRAAHWAIYRRMTPYITRTRFTQIRLPHNRS
jgi:hypothetical protein